MLHSAARYSFYSEDLPCRLWSVTVLVVIQLSRLVHDNGLTLSSFKLDLDTSKNITDYSD